MRDGSWKLYYPRIPEAMVKIQADTEDYRQNFNRPHMLREIDNPPVERRLSEPNPPELYNLADDPYEAHDLAKEHPERVLAMKLALENWFDAVERDRKAISSA